MGTRIYLSIFLGTLFLFIWNAVSWMALPFHTNTLRNFPENALEMEKLKELMPESGVYHFPGLPEGDHARPIQEIEERLAEGPRITLMVYRNEPSKLFEPSSFLFSFIINLLTVVCTLFLISKHSNHDRKIIMITTVLIGVISALLGDVSQMNWFKFPLDYTLANVLDKIIAFIVLGLLFSRYTFKHQIQNG